MSYRTSRSFEVKTRIIGREEWRLTLERIKARNNHIQALQDEVNLLEADCFKLSAGVCEFRSGNDHGNAMCLATGSLIESMKIKT